MRLRSVELAVPDAGAAAEFLEGLWGLIPVGMSKTTRYFRATGDHPYVLAMTVAATPAVRAIEFSCAHEEIEALHARARRADATVSTIAALDAPGGGKALVVHGPEAQIFRFVVETERTPALAPQRDKPIQITHAVINALDGRASERFAVEVLGFAVSDRTRAMTFLRCNRKHHALAYAYSDVSSLNHIAFEMNDLDSVMRGIGRMQDAGHAAVWGPGRHGPGNNAFAYFVAPYGGVIEYTAEVADVGDDYRVGGPQDWTWPPGRMDQWGISRKDTARTAAAERVFRFPGAPH